MKIVDKQTIRIPLVLIIALFIFSVTIYLFFIYFREFEFYAYLQSTSINRSKMLFDEGINAKQYNSIDVDLKESAYIQKQYIIYDSTGKVLYKSSNAIPHLTDKSKKEVLKGKITFKKDGFEKILFTSTENKHHKLYIYEASGYDLAGFKRQEKLLYTLVLSSLFLIALIIFITRFYIRKDLKPIGKIANRMREISSKNLQKRVPEADLKNEIGVMAHTFNELLDRLEASYIQQQNFVSYATHELRTPLSILLGNAQVTLMKDRSTEEYKQTVENFQYDINNMINLVNSLLELARMNADAQSVPFNEVRVDEVLWAASDSLRQKKTDYKINIGFVEIPENDEAMIVNGNAELLLLVFRNLMENACKYSKNHEVAVKIQFKESNILLDFIDEGVGMSAAEIEHIFEAFYRTEKTKDISGHGVGLPLSKRVVEIHQGKISVQSIVGKGSTFSVELPTKK